MAATISTANCTRAATAVAGTSLACTFPGANTVGNTLICFVGIFRASTVAASTVSVSDNAGNVWTRVSSAETSSVAAAWMTGSMFYAQNCLGTTNTVTSSVAASSSFISMWIGEIDTPAAISLDPSASTKGASSRQTHAGITLTSTGELAVCGISDLSGGSTAYGWSTATGSLGPMVARPEWSVLTGSSFQRIGGCTLNAVSSGLFKPTSSFASLSTQWASVVAGFLPFVAVGGGAPRPLFPMMGAGR